MNTEMIAKTEAFLKDNAGNLPISKEKHPKSDDFGYFDIQIRKNQRLEFLERCVIP